MQPDNWNAPQKTSEDKTWKLLEQAVLAQVIEQRRKRRWGIFFKLLGFAYLLAVLALFSPFESLEKTNTHTPHTALIEIRGVIADEERANADTIISSLRAAFENPATRGVVLRINSPGGSPVQSGLVYDEIKRLRTLHPDIKLYAVITDLGASGAYYIASAADAIYADKASLVGSIGVTASGFGFVEAMKKLGVERRIYTAGEHKGFLDPFVPQQESEQIFWKDVLQTTHKQFIASVKAGRGDRLKDGEHPELFSGLVWTGEQAVALGLIDALGSVDSVARDVIGQEVIVDFTEQESTIDRLAKRVGAGVSEQIALRLGLSTSPVLH